eukprot:m.70916 g.70916  ORF g.70916 m.70916 type:complete len:207 (-) comp12185_c0_seq2:63-683(-)
MSVLPPIKKHESITKRSTGTKKKSVKDVIAAYSTNKDRKFTSSPSTFKPIRKAKTIHKFPTRKTRNIGVGASPNRKAGDHKEVDDLRSHWETQTDIPKAPRSNHPKGKRKAKDVPKYGGFDPPTNKTNTNEGNIWRKYFQQRDTAKKSHMTLLTTTRVGVWGVQQMCNLTGPDDFLRKRKPPNRHSKKYLCRSQKKPEKNSPNIRK